MIYVLAITDNHCSNYKHKTHVSQPHLNPTPIRQARITTEACHDNECVTRLMVTRDVVNGYT